MNFTIIKNVGYFEGKHNSLTGSVNFYRSNIKIQNSQFIGNQSEDALNVTESNLDIKNCKFKNISSDALDSDFSNINIQNVRFEDIYGDAIDTSGSIVKIKMLLLEMLVINPYQQVKKVL